MIPIDEIKELELQAQNLYLYFNENDKKDKKYLEAFLLQTALMEGLVVELALRVIKNKKYLTKIISKKEQRYGFANAVNDLYLLKIIDYQKFEELDKYIKNRNKYVHGWLKYDSFSETEEKLKVIYENARSLLWFIITKLEKI